MIRWLRVSKGNMMKSKIRPNTVSEKRKDKAKLNLYVEKVNLGIA